MKLIILEFSHVFSAISEEKRGLTVSSVILPFPYIYVTSPINVSPLPFLFVLFKIAFKFTAICIRADAVALFQISLPFALVQVAGRVYAPAVAVIHTAFEESFISLAIIFKNEDASSVSITTKMVTLIQISAFINHKLEIPFLSVDQLILSPVEWPNFFGNFADFFKFNLAGLEF